MENTESTLGIERVFHAITEECKNITAVCKIEMTQTVKGLAAIYSSDLSHAKNIKFLAHPGVSSNHQRESFENSNSGRAHIYEAGARWSFCLSGEETCARNLHDMDREKLREWFRVHRNQALGSLQKSFREGVLDNIVRYFSDTGKYFYANSKTDTARRIILDAVENVYDYEHSEFPDNFLKQNFGKTQKLGKIKFQGEEVEAELYTLKPVMKIWKPSDQNREILDARLITGHYLPCNENGEKFKILLGVDFGFLMESTSSDRLILYR